MRLTVLSLVLLVFSYLTCLASPASATPIAQFDWSGAAGAKWAPLTNSQIQPDHLLLLTPTNVMLHGEVDGSAPDFGLFGSVTSTASGYIRADVLQHMSMGMELSTFFDCERLGCSPTNSSASASLTFQVYEFITPTPTASVPQGASASMEVKILLDSLGPCPAHGLITDGTADVGLNLQLSSASLSGLPLSIDCNGVASGTLDFRMGNSVGLVITFSGFALSGGANVFLDATNTARVVLAPNGNFDYTTASGFRYDAPQETAPVPEPATLALTASGLVVLTRRRPAARGR